MNKLKDITVYSEDPQLLRLLAIELSRTGRSVGEKCENCLLLVFDGDSENIPEIPHVFSACITRRHDISGSSAYDAILKRPVSFSELRETVNHFLNERLSRTAPEETDELLLLPDQKVLICNGHQVSLTPNEYSLLSLLLENRGNAVSREQIKERIGGDGNSPEVYICMLRKKLTFDRKCLIVTLRGQGYIIH